VEKFYSQEIQVKTCQKSGIPSAFIWRGREYRIREIWGEWPDFGFGSMTQEHWWQRRHRTYFRVVTEDDEVFEIYLDRGARRKKWVLYRQLDTSCEQDSKRE